MEKKGMEERCKEGKGRAGRRRGWRDWRKEK